MNLIKINKNFEINLLDLIPIHYLIRLINKDFVEVYYKTNGRGNSPKPFRLPKKIAIDELFMEGISMYIGDGKLSTDLNHLEFTSKDKDMLKFMFKFFSRKI